MSGLVQNAALPSQPLVAMATLQAEQSRSSKAPSLSFLVSVWRLTRRCHAWVPRSRLARRERILERSLRNRTNPAHVGVARRNSLLYDCSTRDFRDIPAVVRTEFPFEVETVDPFWIVLADGTRIAATLWRPVTDTKVPVVVEMLPYRRRDGTVCARHGHASLVRRPRHRLLAGSTSAAPAIPAANSPTNICRASRRTRCEIIACLAAQPWCNGNVGMTGISWGGFNSLQVAARRPPALKAIITLCASDDRYADDIHYMGGALLTEQEMWSNFMLVKKAMPPDPQIVGDALARHVGGAAGTATAPVRDLARASAPRRLLEAGLGLRGLFQRSTAR